MINVIGLVGEMGAGKSTVAKYLVEIYGAEVLSFAGPLKKMLGKVFGFTHEQLHGTQAQKAAIDPRYNFSARWAAQAIGTDGLREEFFEDIHVEAFRRTVLPTLDPSKVYVFEDVRFENEAEFIAAGDDETINGVLLKIEKDKPARHWLDCSVRCKADATKHKSELLEIDPGLILGTIHNNTDEGMHMLYMQVEAFIHNPFNQYLCRTLNANKKA